MKLTTSRVLETLASLVFGLPCLRHVHLSAYLISSRLVSFCLVWSRSVLSLFASFRLVFLSRSVSFCSVSFCSVSFPLASFYLVSSRSNLFCLVSSRSTSFPFISFCLGLVSSRFLSLSFSFHLVLSPSFRLVSSHLVPSRSVSSCLVRPCSVSSHLVSFGLVPFHLVLSRSISLRLVFHLIPSRFVSISLVLSHLVTFWMEKTVLCCHSVAS
jgi:hypothetical protein